MLDAGSAGPEAGVIYPERSDAGFVWPPYTGDLSLWIDGDHMRGELRWSNGAGEVPFFKLDLRKQ